MDQEKIGKFIKDIRKKNNLTQKDLADKYGVTYQAVSKWERGINIPDVSLLREMSKDFNVNIEDILEGEYKEKKKKINYIYILFLIIFIFILLLILLLNRNNNIELKTISSSCDSFDIIGSIAYNDSKSQIYISNINYCGEEDNTLYRSLECTLYEVNGDNEKKIGSYKYEDGSITLKDFLDKVVINTDNYNRTCKNYNENSLYILVSGTKDNGESYLHKIPLNLDNCMK